jgi:thiamine pyrophosphate-dependent acetolactate synthase large subunit-like protein
MGEGMPKNENVFSEIEKARMLEDARINEERQRAMTGGDASENTQEIFEEEERRRAIAEADPNKPAQYELDEKKNEEDEKERSKRAIERIRATLRAKEPEFPDYGQPPITPKAEKTK